MQCVIARHQVEPTALVVDADNASRSQTVRSLEGAGYRVSAVPSFDAAKQALRVQGPDLLVTALRLGPYNGLHLVLRSRTDHPNMAALVTASTPDPVLQAEAERMRAGFLLMPTSRQQLLDAIARLVPKAAPTDAAPAR